MFFRRKRSQANASVLTGFNFLHIVCDYLHLLEQLSVQKYKQMLIKKKTQKNYFLDNGIHPYLNDLKLRIYARKKKSQERVIMFFIDFHRCITEITKKKYINHDRGQVSIVFNVTNFRRKPRLK